MNGKELLAGMTGIDSKFIDEVENENAAGKPVRRAPRKLFLVAAIIATMLLLVGCAVVYVWKMQNIKVGQQTETKPVIATDGMSILGYEEVEQQVLTLAGLKGSPGYQAAVEWFQFKQSYDPDHILHMQMLEDDTVPDFPAEYDAYNIYSQEMKDKLDTILETYSLKPAGASLGFRTVKNMCSALGIERIQAVENGVTVSVSGGGCRENGNFSLSLDFTLPEAPENEINNTWGYLRWNRKDCFSEDLIAIEDTGDWKEWNYTTSSGNEVLIIRSDSDWRGWFLCEREDAILSLQIEARRDLGYNVDGKTWWEYLYLTDKQMEQIADAIDFGIQPNIVTQADVDNQPGASNAKTQDGYTVELKNVETDGRIAYITLGITAPEGKVISRTTRAGHEDEYYNINTANFLKLLPVNGDSTGGGTSLIPQEDGDGLDNTQNFVMEADVSMRDGSMPFKSGAVWKVRLEDLIHSYYDSERYMEVEEILAEGEWEFEITFGEENGDYRELELIEEPVTVNAAGGFYPDGRDADQIVEVNSFKLRKFSATIGYGEVEYVDFSVKNGEWMYVVMKDGSEVRLAGSRENYSAESPIDLDQVAYVRMVDGTVIPVPGVDAKVDTASQSPVSEEEGVELLTQPLTYKSLAGYAVGPDGIEEPLYESLQLTSITLSSSGLTVKGPSVFESPDTQIELVMRDGSKIMLTGCGGGPYSEPMSKLAAETPIDPAQAAYVLLPDGTKLMVPETVK